MISDSNLLLRKENQTGLNETDLESLKLNDKNSSTNSVHYKSFILLFVIFIGSLFLLYSVYLSFPNLEENEKEFIKVPKNIADAKKLGIVLKKYSHEHFYSVLAAVLSAYVFLQTFAIPGSIFLTILCGFLYPFKLALTIVCFCSATGASFCYFLSFIVARRIVLKYFNQKIVDWQRQASRHKHNMLFYIIFLRITPFVPNWLMNLASPLIDIPLLPFVLGTFLGVAPPSCFYIQAGTTLKDLTSSSDALNFQSFLILGLVSLVSLLPVLFRKQLKKNIE